MSRLLVDVEEELSMPGGIGFIDATDALKSGTEDMECGDILSVENFTLQDSMSALEIMDPRMDSGMAVPPPPFDPHMPLLPSEVCWIIDRSFACETSWHSGLALSQTVHTLQYVHYLTDIAYPRFKAGPTTRSPYEPEDPERPMQLVTLVLRAGVFGLLKCCELAWKELARDHLVDGEDWNSEKFGVPLCEGVQPEALLVLLDEAVTWLGQSPLLSSSPWRDPLIQRILMRKNILQTFAYPTFPALRTAEYNLGAILTGPSPPEPGAAVQAVFDPAIARRLVSFVPTRVVDLPPQVKVWEALAMWLDRWQEVRRLIGADHLLSVKVLATLRAYEEQSPRRSAFLRSLSISTFFNGSKILITHEPPWLIDRFFWEMAALEPGLLTRLADHLSDNESNGSSSSLDDQDGGKRESGSVLSDTEARNKIVELFEKGLAKLLVDHFSSYFHNRARQRRKLADALLDWHLAFEHASAVVTRLSSAPSPDLSLTRVPLCVRHLRLSIIAEVLFSGFELELYTRDEWSMVYWYGEQVFRTQISVLDELKASITRPHGRADVRNAMAYVSYQREYAEALQYFSSAMRDILYHHAPAKPHHASREQANFERRFKWAFITGYSEAETLDEDRPILGKWRRWRNARADHAAEMNQAIGNLTRARDVFYQLSTCEPAKTSAIFCQEAHKEFMLRLTKTCDRNLRFLQAPPWVRATPGPEWVWDTSRWFPEPIDP